MVHAAGMKQPGGKDEYEVWEHHFIGIWESPMLMFIKDNPEVVAWLQLEEEPASGQKKKPSTGRPKA
jgi:hypothetical protein